VINSWGSACNLYKDLKFQGNKVVDCSLIGEHNVSLKLMFPPAMGMEQATRCRNSIKHNVKRIAYSYLGF
jgi:hypothetical protein